LVTSHRTIGDRKPPSITSGIGLRYEALPMPRLMLRA
jgi:hypothetical protein